MLALFGFLLFAAEPGAGLVLDTRQISAGGEVSVSLSRVLPADALVSGCQKLGIERYDEGRRQWIADPPLDCVIARPAQALEAEKGLKVSIPAERFSIARVVLVYGLGCEKGLPLEQAGCRDLLALTSENISVQAPPPK